MYLQHHLFAHRTWYCEASATTQHLSTAWPHTLPQPCSIRIRQLQLRHLLCTLRCPSCGRPTAAGAGCLLPCGCQLYCQRGIDALVGPSQPQLVGALGWQNVLLKGGSQLQWSLHFSCYFLRQKICCSVHMYTCRLRHVDLKSLPVHRCHIGIFTGTHVDGDMLIFLPLLVHRCHIDVACCCAPKFSQTRSSIFLHI